MSNYTFRPMILGVLALTALSACMPTATTSTDNTTTGAQQPISTTATTLSSFPVKIVANSVVVGGQQSCSLILRTGVVSCWNNAEVDSSSFPTASPIVSPVAFKAITAGEFHFCGLGTDNKAYCWGNNTASQLGNSGKNSAQAIAVGDYTFKSISAGLKHSCGLTTSNTLMCWGDEWSTPTLLQANTTFKSVTAGGRHSCAIAVNHQAYCWGYGGQGQLGQGAFVSSANPVLLKGGIGFKQLALGRQHSCGLGTNNRIYCWGKGALDNVSKSIPTQVAGTQIFKSITANQAWSCGLDTNDRLYCWGDSIENPLKQNFSRPTLVQTEKILSFSLNSRQICFVSTGNTVRCSQEVHFDK